MSKGKFVVIYGANNLGKSVQADLLTEGLAKKGLKVKRIKYPIYDLKPTGPQINRVLRKGEEISELDFQKLYVQNRVDFEPKLKSFLEKGYWVVAEDYKGTGIAWGMVGGLALATLEKINKGLLEEDLAILLYGKRFEEGIEKGHRNEVDDKIWKTAQKTHLELGKKYGWKKVKANGTKKEVHESILKALKKAKII